MDFLARMSLKSRLVTILVTFLALVAILISLLAIMIERKEMRQLAQDRVNFGLTGFATGLTSSAQGFVAGPASAEALTSLARTKAEVKIDPSVVDRVLNTLDVHVTYFQFNPETAELKRLMTSIRGADGARAVGTNLDPEGPAYQALLAGKVYIGDADILGLPYVTRYEPVFDGEGKLSGAVFSGVTIASINEVVIDYMAGLGLPTLILVLGAFFVSRSMINHALSPVRGMVEIVNRLEKRDYDVVITPPATKDEISALALACTGLRDDLREGARLAEVSAAQEQERVRQQTELARVVTDLRNGLAKLADGDLMTFIPNTPENPFPPAYDSLRESFNAVIDRFGVVIDQVNSIARSVRDSAVEITDASRELSTRAETQAATLEQSAAALTELTQSVASTAERAGMAQEASFGNRKGAERGSQIVQEAVSAMQGIEKGAEQITRIIGVIEDIAFQTNLLALNAGVEAARAGDAGRGFAVVASEVRLLAQRASDSAREIKTLISDSTKRVEDGSALVRRTGESLTEILGRANDAAGLVADIAMAAAEQARGLAEVNTGVNQLDHVTQQNSAVAEETSAAAATLQARSEELIVALAGFRTGQKTASLPPRGQQRPADRQGAVIEANVVDWAAAAATAANGPRANPVKPNVSWAEF